MYSHENLRPAGSSYGFGFFRSAIQLSTILAHFVRVSCPKVLENCSKANACFLRIATASLKRLRNKGPAKSSRKSQNCQTKRSTYEIQQSSENSNRSNDRLRFLCERRAPFHVYWEQGSWYVPRMFRHLHHKFSQHQECS